MWRRHLPLGVAATGAAIALVGTGVHLSALTASLTDPGATTAASTTSQPTGQAIGRTIGQSAGQEHAAGPAEAVTADVLH